MKIGIDAFPILSSYGGVSNYVRWMVSKFQQGRSEHEFFSYIPNGSLEQVEAKFGKSRDGFQWKEVGRLEFSRRGRIDGLDLFHGPNFKCQTRGRFGSVLTIHDLWLDRHPEYSRKLLGQRLSFFRTRRRVEDATIVIAVSEFTAKEIQQLYGVPPEHIAVIYHGVSPIFFPDHDLSRFAELRNRWAFPDKPYILFVGGAEPRKNHQAVFRAFSHESFLKENFNLVVVGNPCHQKGTVWDCAQTCGIRSRLFSFKAISEDELRILYSHAALFVFPSKYEGFGFPVLEAMACGVPVITSNCSALPEVVGKAAVLVDPESSEELAHAMVRVLMDSDLQIRLTRNGFERIVNFNWEGTANKTLELYDRFLRN